MGQNEQAFLDTVAYSEGTFGKGDNGYNVLFGGNFFTDYAKHPRIEYFIERLGIYTTAAGRYQINAPTYDEWAEKLGVSDFTPTTQDEIALRLIQTKSATPLVDSGYFDAAVLRCAPIWASFPGAGYGQPENKLSDLRTFFVKQGGLLCPQTNQL